MKPDLQKKLYRKYPKLFAQKGLSMDKTAMCWGIETDDGWYDLIDKLCGFLTATGHNQIEISQMKQKHGSLRVYTANTGDMFFMGAISFAEYLSRHTCEICGDEGELCISKSGWKMSLCRTHRKEMKYMIMSRIRKRK